MASELHAETSIQASPQRVWEVLTNFAAYHEWNPYIPQINGSVEAGSRLDVQLQPPGARGMRMRPTVLAATPSQELRWLGHLGILGLFDGEHRFRIDYLGPDRVRFVQEERFTGLLAPIVLRFIERGTRQGFESMNQALKSRAERRSPSR